MLLSGPITPNPLNPAILYRLKNISFPCRPGAAHAQQLKRIKIGYPSLSFRQSNVWVAREMGLFNKYGLEVEPILFRGGQVATQALVSGDPPIVNIGTVVQATIQGHNLVLTAAVETKYDLIVFSRRGSPSSNNSKASASASPVSTRRPITLRSSSPAISASI